MTTPATMATIQVTGTNHDAIVDDDVARRVVTCNGRSHDATVIDAASRQVVDTIALPGKPAFAVADGRGRRHHS